MAVFTAQLFIMQDGYLLQMIFIVLAINLLLFPENDQYFHTYYISCYSLKAKLASF